MASEADWENRGRVKATGQGCGAWLDASSFPQLLLQGLYLLSGPRAAQQAPRSNLRPQGSPIAAFPDGSSAPTPPTRVPRWESVGGVPPLRAWGLATIQECTVC